MGYHRYATGYHHHRRRRRRRRHINYRHGAEAFLRSQ